LEDTGVAAAQFSIDLALWDHAISIERIEVESMQDFHRSWLRGAG